MVSFAFLVIETTFYAYYQKMVSPTETSVLPIIMQLICMLASACVCAIRLVALVKNSLAPSLVLPLGKCSNKSVAQTGSPHHSCGISVKFLICQSAIFR